MLNLLPSVRTACHHRSLPSPLAVSDVPTGEADEPGSSECHREEGHDGQWEHSKVVDRYLWRVVER